MADKKTTKEETGSGILDSFHKVLLAGMGAFNLAQEEIEDFVNKLVERGEVAEKDGRKFLNDLRDGQKKQTKKVEKEVDKRFEQVLDRLNIPTKSDIDTLNKKIAELTAKIDDLQKS